MLKKKCDSNHFSASAARCTIRFHRTMIFSYLHGAGSPNVKDEPRPWLARRVRHEGVESEVSFRDAFDSTRRDSHGRWLWRLVRLVWFSLEWHCFAFFLACFL